MFTFCDLKFRILVVGCRCFLLLCESVASLHGCWIQSSNQCLCFGFEVLPSMASRYKKNYKLEKAEAKLVVCPRSSTVPDFPCGTSDTHIYLYVLLLLLESYCAAAAELLSREAVLLRCTRHAEDRSGAWMVTSFCLRLSFRLYFIICF